jgi:DNA-directed RNA polymerase I, II, and III subunit RPABC5
MIIPIKCVTCGMVLADKYRYYLEKVRQNKLASSSTNTVSIDKVIYFTKDGNTSKTKEAEVMDELGMRNMCCRRVFLTHVDVD